MNFTGILFHHPAQGKGARIALIGAGGKSSLQDRLGQEFSEVMDRVLLSSLTKSEFRPEIAPLLMDDLRNQVLPRMFANSSLRYVMKSLGPGGKYHGIDETDLDALCEIADVCIFECDGARKRSLKIHIGRDPTVPALATHVITVVGADVIGTRISDEHVHRPDQFKSVWEIGDDTILDMELVTRVVTSRKGYLSQIPYQTRRYYYVNKAESHFDNARDLAQFIFRSSNCPTFFGSIQESFLHKVA